MTHWLIAPVILPAMLAPFIVLAARYHIGIQRVFSLVGVIAMIAIAAGLSWQASDGTILIYQLGDWAAPFGIILVGDMLSTLMVLLTGVSCTKHCVQMLVLGWDRRHARHSRSSRQNKDGAHHIT